MNPVSGYWSGHIGSIGTSPRQQKSVSIHLDTIHNPTFSTGIAIVSLPCMNKILHKSTWIRCIYIHAPNMHKCMHLFSIYSNWTIYWTKNWFRNNIFPLKTHKSRTVIVHMRGISLKLHWSHVISTSNTKQVWVTFNNRSIYNVTYPYW